MTQLITAAFILARSRYPELDKTWISISVRGGGLLPNSPLVASVQRTGELDMVLRCMEDDFSPAPEGAGEVGLFSFNYQKMLSELWVGAVYEIFRVLTTTTRKNDVLDLARDLKLLRIPLEKYEIANDKKSSDAKQAYITSEISSRGSVRWQVIDVKSKSFRWLERRALSERIVALLGPVAAEPPVSGDTES